MRRARWLLLGLGVALGASGVLAAPPSRAPRPPAAPPKRRLPTPWRLLSEAEREALLATASALPLTEGVLAISAHFLETPYQVSPLGEGGGVDPDPLFRDDAVDCLTFVEQTLALALSRHPGEVDATLSALRYDGAVRYEDRNHLMEAQWLPANLRKGFVRDITRRVGGGRTQRTEKVLTRLTWTSLSSQALQLPRARQLTGRFPLDVLPLEAVRERMDALPPGSILLVVREDLPLKATRITHLGFVVRRGKRTFLRHAARSHYGRVVDEDLETFLLRNARYAKWKVSGVAVLEPQRPLQPAASATP